MDRAFQQQPGAATHAVRYRPEYAHRWHVLHIESNTTIVACATEKMADAICAIHNLRDARPGIQVRNVRTNEQATLIYVWPGHVEVILLSGHYQRWPFAYTRLCEEGQQTGSLPPVTPRSIRLLATSHQQQRSLY